jgi:hypothetical protein
LIGASELWAVLGDKALLSLLVGVMLLGQDKIATTLSQPHPHLVEATGSDVEWVPLLENNASALMEGLGEVDVDGLHGKREIRRKNTKGYWTPPPGRSRLVSTLRRARNGIIRRHAR